jgi:hypothetical protein
MPYALPCSLSGVGSDAVTREYQGDVHRIALLYRPPLTAAGAGLQQYQRFNISVAAERCPAIRLNVECEPQDGAEGFVWELPSEFCRKGFLYQTPSLVLSALNFFHQCGCEAVCIALIIGQRGLLALLCFRLPSVSQSRASQVLARTSSSLGNTRTRR